MRVLLSLIDSSLPGFHLGNPLVLLMNALKLAEHNCDLWDKPERQVLYTGNSIPILTSLAAGCNKV